MAKTYVIGGQGTGGDASANNGGAFNPAGTATYSTFQGTNGGPIATCSAGTISNAAGFVVITKAGQFATVVNNSFANCVFTGVLTSGRYEVASHTNDTITLVLSYVAGADAETADVYVGGALDTIGTAKALPAAGDQLLLAGERTYTIGASLVPTTGTATSIIVTKGVNKADGTDITDNTKRPVVQPSTDLVGMLDIQDASDYNHFYDIVFDGDDGGGNTADYAVYNNIGGSFALNCHWCNCDFKNCDIDGFYWNARTANFSLHGCNITDNGGKGINSAYAGGVSLIFGCCILRNSDVGLYMIPAANAYVYGNLIADNSSYGLQIYRYLNLSTIEYNTIINNASDGIYIAYGTAALNVAQADNLIANNIIAYNGGYGVNAHANATAQLYAEQIVRNNYFYGNTSGAWPSAINQFFAHVSNVTNVDPLFMDRSNATVALRDYRLQCTSTILHAGFQGTVVGYGALNTIDFPAAASVLETDTVNGSAGTLAADDVLTTAGGDYVGPATTDVKDGVFYGPDSNYEGEYVGGGGGGTPPAAPSIAATAGTGSVTITIDGAAGVTNYVKYKGNHTAWQDGGSRSGDGDVTISGLDNDIVYTFVVYSESGGLYSTPSPAVNVTLTADQTGEIETYMAGQATIELSKFGETVTYKPAGGGSRAILAIREDPADSEDGSAPGTRGPRLTWWVHNNVTTGISAAELNTGGDKLTCSYRKGVAAIDRRIVALLEQHHDMIQLEVR